MNFDVHLIKRFITYIKNSIHNLPHMDKFIVMGIIVLSNQSFFRHLTCGYVFNKIYFSIMQMQFNTTVLIHWFGIYTFITLKRLFPIWISMFLTLKVLCKIVADDIHFLLLLSFWEIKTAFHVNCLLSRHMKCQALFFLFIYFFCRKKQQQKVKCNLLQL